MIISFACRLYSGRLRISLLTKKKGRREPRYSAGSLKRAHHFGLNRAATFGEQLILQDAVTQSNKPSLLPVVSGGAAAIAAGEDKGMPG